MVSERLKVDRAVRDVVKRHVFDPADFVIAAMEFAGPIWKWADGGAGASAEPAKVVRAAAVLVLSGSFVGAGSASGGKPRTRPRASSA